MRRKERGPRKAVATVLSALSLITSGCCTFFRGVTQPVVFYSDPAGAQVEIESGPKCQTPCYMNVRRSNTPPSYVVTMQGRETFSAELIPAQEGNALWLFPIVFDGLLVVPGIVDLATYTLWNYPREVSVVLPPEGQGTARAVVKR
jgi:hypothetical protein